MIKYIIKIVKSLEDSALLLKGVSETIQNEAKKQKSGLLRMVLGALGTRLLGNILVGKGMNRAVEGVIRTGDGGATKRWGRGIVRSGYGNKTDF